MLFSNFLFKGVGRHPKLGKNKVGIKVHTVIHANLLAIDRTCIDYAKFEELTLRGVIYVTKMKKNLNYEVHSDTIYQNPEGLMKLRIQKLKKLVPQVSYANNFLRQSNVPG